MLFFLFVLIEFLQKYLLLNCVELPSSTHTRTMCAVVILEVVSERAQKRAVCMREREVFCGEGERRILEARNAVSAPVGQWVLVALLVSRSVRCWRICKEIARAAPPVEPGR